MGAQSEFPILLSGAVIMKTCKIINCWRKQKCHLEEQGMEDLCPAVKEIVESAKEQTERAWREQTHDNNVVSLSRFKGTVRTISDQFTINVALQHMENRDKARREKFLKERKMERDYNIKIIDPGPLPQPWLPLSENNKFYDFNTNIEDRSASIVGVDPEESKKKLLKAHRIIIKQERMYTEELQTRMKLNKIQDIRDEKILRMLESMEE